MLNLNGATRLYPIVGDPIAQVKSPAGVSETLQAAGKNALVVPIHVAPAHLAAYMAGAAATQNVDGIIVTVPHKFAMYAFCSTASPRAHFLQAVNTLRRNADGTWHGDMFDGLGYVAALQKAGCTLAGKKVLLVGAGGAGSAIAHAVLVAGAAQLAVHEVDDTRRNALLARLNSLQLGQVLAGSNNPTGFDVIINATPTGMKVGDPMPIETEKLLPTQFVGDVITAPVVTPMITAARAKGCGTILGADMFANVRDLLVAFLLEI